MWQELTNTCVLAAGALGRTIGTERANTHLSKIGYSVIINILIAGSELRSMSITSAWTYPTPGCPKPSQPLRLESRSGPIYKSQSYAFRSVSFQERTMQPLTLPFLYIYTYVSCWPQVHKVVVIGQSYIKNADEEKPVIGDKLRISARLRRQISSVSSIVKAHKWM